MNPTYLTIGALVILLVVLVIKRFVTNGIPTDDNHVSDKWLRDNAYEKKGYDK